MEIELIAVMDSQERYASYFRSLANKASRRENKMALNAEANGIEVTCSLIRESIKSQKQQKETLDEVPDDEYRYLLVFRDHNGKVQQATSMFEYKSATECAMTMLGVFDSLICAFKIKPKK